MNEVDANLCHLRNLRFVSLERFSELVARASLDVVVDWKNADALRQQVRRLTNKKQQSFCDWPNEDQDFPLLKSAR